MVDNQDIYRKHFMMYLDLYVQRLTYAKVVILSEQKIILLFDQIGTQQWAAKVTDATPFKFICLVCISGQSAVQLQ